ncbi:hypothetical protein BO224_10960 [Erysipelotrichaceae bacterium NYU-BL-E8]|uniref:Uncharacterized protein n=1 Tax=Ileibacterium valens TaxID=1862668 RepID=A0A1U7NCS4_9FIRM|nr:hypothetical protein BO222_12465 [Ileibacterium valens]OLU37370.1 hypothetical protein BO224_10960 [Erysipelotrichaceae bacterium NYU-BL-E8]OLU42346.1 hypothetical protein BM735_02465 [Erysipelotrichaceae bacterium NYU-BL-F16]
MDGKHLFEARCCCKVIVLREIKGLESDLSIRKTQSVQPTCEKRTFCTSPEKLSYFQLRQVESLMSKGEANQ